MAVGDYEDPVANIVMEGGVPKLTSAGLGGANGVVYVIYGTTPATMDNVAELEFDQATGKAVLPTVQGASATLYRLCVGYSLPQVTEP